MANAVAEGSYLPQARESVEKALIRTPRGVRYTGSPEVIEEGSERVHVGW
jgi:hypothetical protein